MRLSLRAIPEPAYSLLRRGWQREGNLWRHHWIGGGRWMTVDRAVLLERKHDPERPIPRG